MMEIEDSQSPAKICMYVNGPLFREGIPLHVMIGSLKDFQAIIDKSYLSFIKGKRISKDEREKFYLRSYGVEHHSLETWVEIVMAGSQTLMPFYSYLSPEGIWEVTKQSWEMIKQIMPYLKNTGKTPEFHFEGHGHSSFTVVTGDQSNNYYGPVYNATQNSLPLYQDLAQKIDSKSIDTIKFGDRTGNPISISEDETKFLLLPSTVSKETVTLECEIFEFDKHVNKGKLSVFDEQEIPLGEYRFSVIGNQNFVLYIEAMLRQVVNIVALIEYIPDPFVGEKIKAIQIIEIVT